jgi:hypothetical protein
VCHRCLGDRSRPDGSGVAADPLADAARRAVDATPQAVVLVEGFSDRLAVEELALRRGRDLAGDGVLVVPMAGATNLAQFLAVFGPPGLDLRVCVLSDAREAAAMRRLLHGVGLPESVLHVCTEDLEDELIRALGPSRVCGVVEAEGDLRAFRSLQHQPEWREAPLSAQLRRFFGSGAGRKIRYGKLLAEALDPAELTGPLDTLLRAL